MKMAITTLSSKGQIVIPKELREDMQIGEKLLIIKEGDNLIIKASRNISKQMAQDIEFARRTDLAWEEIKAGKGIRMSFEEFEKEMEKW